MSSSIDKKSLRILISDSESDSEVKSRSDKNSSQRSSKQSQSSNKSSSLRPKSGYKGEDKRSNAIIESSDDDDFNSNKNNFKQTQLKSKSRSRSSTPSTERYKATENQEKKLLETIAASNKKIAHFSRPRTKKTSSNDDDSDDNGLGSEIKEKTKTKMSVSHSNSTSPSFSETANSMFISSQTKSDNSGQRRKLKKNSFDKNSSDSDTQVTSMNFEVLTRGQNLTNLSYLFLLRFICYRSINFFTIYFYYQKLKKKRTSASL